MDFDLTLLCCDEDLVDIFSPPSHPSSNPPSIHPHSSPFPFPEPFSFPPDADDQLSIAILQKKLSDCSPSEAYALDLRSHPHLSRLRCNAARWMIKAHFLLKFGPSTAALAVNYLDRYLEKNLLMPWKSWMIDLLSIACLSVAAKMEEVDVPALLDLQADGLEHLFEAKTVQRMELNVLSALGWRLRSITPFTFMEKVALHLDITQELKSMLMARSSELLLASLAEVEFLDFEPYVVAVTAIYSSLEEILPLRINEFKILILDYIPLDADKLKDCYKVMEALIVDPVSYPTGTMSGDLKFPPSPNTVVCHHIDDDSRCHSAASAFCTVEGIENGHGSKRQRRL